VWFENLKLSSQDNGVVKFSGQLRGWRMRKPLASAMPENEVFQARALRKERRLGTWSGVVAKVAAAGGGRWDGAVWFENLKLSSQDNGVVKFTRTWM
jgi:hypothetical protein